MNSRHLHLSIDLLYIVETILDYGLTKILLIFGYRSESKKKSEDTSKSSSNNLSVATPNTRRYISHDGYFIRYHTSYVSTSTTDIDDILVI